MADATFEDHPTDPNKVILRKKPHLDKGRDYEEGFIDGMQHQMQSSVDKAVNAMKEGKDFTISKPWVGLTSDNFNDFNPLFKAEEAVRWAEAKLKEKNT